MKKPAFYDKHGKAVHPGDTVRTPNGNTMLVCGFTAVMPTPPPRPMTLAAPGEDCELIDRIPAKVDEAKAGDVARAADTSVSQSEGGSGGYLDTLVWGC